MVRVIVRALFPLVLMAAVAAPARAFNGCDYADVNGDEVVDAVDYGLVVDVLGLPDARRDLDGNGTVGKEDVAIVLGFLGAVCSESCPADLDLDGDVDGDDRALLVADFGLDCRPDLDRDGRVDGDGRGGDDDVLFAYYNQPAPPYTAASRADLRVDQYVDKSDYRILAAAVPRDCRSDLNSDGAVDLTDVWVLLASWGSCP